MMNKFKCIKQGRCQAILRQLKFDLLKLGRMHGQPNGQPLIGIQIRRDQLGQPNSVE